jgi:glycosyltransferase involved in cell wall biosynthesis
VAASLKAIFLSARDTGGAGIAALRLLHALRAQGVDVSMRVTYKSTTDAYVFGTTGWHRWMAILREESAKAILRFGSRVRSANIFPTGMHRLLNQSGADLVHLHWIGAETIRVEEIARIRAPLIWTLHDEWAYCGTDHYAQGEAGQAGAASTSRLEHWVLRRKQQSWRELDLTVVCPSQWLAARARQSSVLQHKRVVCIPNPIAVDVFRPASRSALREQLGLPQKKILVLFGAQRATRDPRKGFAELSAALAALAATGRAQEMELVVFGDEAGDGLGSLAIPARSMGTIADPHKLAALYAACDLFACPSSQDNLPNTVMEAMACGTPCVAFDVGGLRDLITHGVSGYLARPEDVQDLARGIEACSTNRDEWGRSARAYACENFAEAVVASRYRALYEAAIG